MALFKILRGTSAALQNQPYHDGYAYFTSDTGCFYIDVQLDTEPDYYYTKGKENGKDVYRIELESQVWNALNETKASVNITLNPTKKAYITGVENTPASTQKTLNNITDTGVYLTTTAGELNATQYKVNEKAYMHYDASADAIAFTFV